MLFHFPKIPKAHLSGPEFCWNPRDGSWGVANLVDHHHQQPNRGKRSCDCAQDILGGSQGKSGNSNESWAMEGPNPGILQAMVRRFGPRRWPRPSAMSSMCCHKTARRPPQVSTMSTLRIWTLDGGGAPGVGEQELPWSVALVVSKHTLSIYI